VLLQSEGDLFAFEGTPIIGLVPTNKPLRTGQKRGMTDTPAQLIILLVRSGRSLSNAKCHRLVSLQRFLQLYIRLWNAEQFVPLLPPQGGRAARRGGGGCAAADGRAPLRDCGRRPGMSALRIDTLLNPNVPGVFFIFQH
jgi:hypothetical protein